jgi:hypothetical protein
MSLFFKLYSFVYCYFYIQNFTLSFLNSPHNPHRCHSCQRRCLLHITFYLLRTVLYDLAKNINFYNTTRIYNMRSVLTSCGMGGTVRVYACRVTLAVKFYQGQKSPQTQYPIKAFVHLRKATTFTSLF